MNATAIALPIRAHLQWGRLRGLYNGLGYVLAMCLLCNLWWTAEGRLPSRGRIRSKGLTIR